MSAPCVPRVPAPALGSPLAVSCGGASVVRGVSGPDGGCRDSTVVTSAGVEVDSFGVSVGTGVFVDAVVVGVDVEPEGVSVGSGVTDPSTPVVGVASGVSVDSEVGVDVDGLVGVAVGSAVSVGTGVAVSVEGGALVAVGVGQSIRESTVAMLSTPV